MAFAGLSIFNSADSLASHRAARVVFFLWPSVLLTICKAGLLGESPRIHMSNGQNSSYNEDPIIFVSGYVGSSLKGCCRI